MELMNIQHRILLIELMDIISSTGRLGDLLHATELASRLAAAGKGRHAYSTIKMASGVQDITCVFVEVAGSYEKKLQSYSVLGWCVVHQWCQNVLVRLTGGWNYLHYITLH